MVVTLVRQSLLVFAKDLLIELRSLSRLSGLVVFALAAVVVIAFTSDSSSVVPVDGEGNPVRILFRGNQAAGALWLAALLASSRGLDQSMAVESEHGALEGMVLWPVRPAAIFFGKATANALILIVLCSILLPVLLALFNTSVEGSLGSLAALVVLGCGALAAPGTLYAALTGRARRSSVILPILLFPLVLPALLAAALGTSLVMQGDVQGQSGIAITIVGVFNLLHWTLGGLVFGRIVEG